MSVSQPTVAFADLCAIKNKGDGGRDHSAVVEEKVDSKRCTDRE